MVWDALALKELSMAAPQYSPGHACLANFSHSTSCETICVIQRSYGLYFLSSSMAIFMI